MIETYKLGFIISKYMHLYNISETMRNLAFAIKADGGAQLAALGDCGVDHQAVELC